MEKIDKMFEIINLIKCTKMKFSDFVLFMEELKNPYLVLIFCILSLRTKDEVTYGASQRLKKLATTPQEMIKKNVSDIEKAIYPVGFYKNKAKQILELSERIVNEYKGQVPNDIDELCKFKGVGRKTANLTLAKGFNIPAICVDTHVHRICNRLGYVKTSAPDETELELRKKLPKELWLDFNTWLVTFGQNICKPINPLCKSCPVSGYCSSFTTNNVF